MFATLSRRRAAQVLAVACFLTAASLAQGQTLLRWKFQPGETLHYRLANQFVEKAQFAGGRQPITMSIDYRVDDVWKIGSVDKEGVATVNRTIDHVRLKVTGPQGVVVDYDSASPTEPNGAAKTFGQVFQLLVQKATVFRINPRGEILTAQPPAGLLDGLRKIVPSVSSFGDFFTSEGERKMQINIRFPEQPVKLGQKWTTSDEFQLPVIVATPLNLEYQYEYLGPIDREGRELQKIAVTTRLTPSQKPAETPSVKPQTPAKPNRAPAANQPLAAPLVNFKPSESTAIIHFDNVHGRIHDGDLKLRVQADLNVRGQQGTLDVDGTVHTELLPAANP